MPLRASFPSVRRTHTVAAVWMLSVSGEPIRTRPPARHPSRQSRPRVAFPVDVFSTVSFRGQRPCERVCRLCPHAAEAARAVGRRIFSPLSPLGFFLGDGFWGSVVSSSGAVTWKSIFLEFLFNFCGNIRNSEGPRLFTFFTHLALVGKTDAFRGDRVAFWWLFFTVISEAWSCGF